MTCNFKQFSFFFCHRPQPKARPRARRRGPFLSVYQAISDFENGLRIYCWMAGWMPKKIRCAVEVRTIFKFDRPSGIPKWKIYKAEKPDVDNLEKSCFDSLVKSGVLVDDSQIVKSSSTKCFVDGKDLEGVDIKIIHVECRTKNGCN